MSDRGSAAGSAVRAPRQHPLVVLAVAVCTGILIDRHLPLELAWWWVLTALALLIWLIVGRRGWHVAASWTLVLAVAAIGGAWHHWSWNLFQPDELGLAAREAAQPVALRATALENPRLVPAPVPNPLRTIARGKESRFKVHVTAVRNRDRWQSASGRAQVFVDEALDGIQAGDELTIFAHLLAPRPALNPREFDAALHQRADRTLCRVYANCSACITSAGPDSWWQPRRWLGRVRSNCQEQLWQNLSHQRSGLAAAVLLGAREQLDRDRVDAFFVTGTIHLFAISGLHVGILALGLFRVARSGLLPRSTALLAVALTVILYAILTDARPPVIRATILVLVSCTAMFLRQRPLAFNSLAASGIIVLLLNPADLFRTGALLSFLAVATLSWCSPWLTISPSHDPLERLIARTRPWPWRAAREIGRPLGQAALATTAIWLVALPIVMYRFHLVSPVALLLNAFLWVPMMLALYAGFGVLLLGGWLAPLARVCGWVCDSSLYVLEWSVQLARDIPGGHHWVAGPAWWWVVVFYTALAAAAVFPQFRPRPRWVVLAATVWVGVWLAMPASIDIPVGDESPELACTFLFMGHGSAVVIELPNGKRVLYDAGTIGSPVSGTRSIASFLWSRGVRRLDAVVVSHADVDHYNALPGLLRQFDVDRVYISPVMFRERSAALDVLRSSLDAASVRAEQICSNSQLTWDENVRIEVLHPPPEGVIGSDNANSIVLAVEYEGVRLLLTGDLETTGLDRVVARQPLNCDIVMAPHHGSPHSDPKAFARWTTPRWTVVSRGHGHEFAEVSAAYGNVGSRVLDTAQYGAIRATVRDGDVDVLSWRRDGWR